MEWWYYTGNLVSDRGAPFGYLLTFFRYQGSPPGAEANWPPAPSAWRTSQIFFAHAAVLDIHGKRHLHDELAARSALGLAGAAQTQDTTTIFLRDWSAEIGASAHFLKAKAASFGFDLALTPLKGIVLHGTNGYSLKGSTPEKASCYYSLPRLLTDGILTIEGKEIRVRGESWMDHEFSSAPLEEDVVGWDWFALQLSDNTEIMLYFLRKKDGTSSAASSGTFVDASGKTGHLTGEAVSATVLSRWRSPRSGALYPAGWRVRIPGLNVELTVTPNMADQEMITPATTGVTYWEGSVFVSGTGKWGRPVTGRGYVELTGYAESAGSRFQTGLRE